MTIIGKTKIKRGRPATGRDPSVTIRLPSALLTWIDAQAERTDIGRSEMIRRLIEELRLGVPQDVSRIRTAYHEAGHAVMARALGLLITIATVEPELKTLGYVGVHLGRINRGDQLAICSHIMCSMAGREAEMMVLGFFHDEKSDRVDRRHIRRLQLLLALPGSDPWKSYLEDVETGLVLEMLRDKTMSAVMLDLKESIKRVASALLRSESLVQSQIDAIIAATGESVTDWNRPGDLRRWNDDYKHRLMARP